MLAATNIVRSELNMKCQWKQIDFQFPTPEARETALKDKSFIPNNVIPIDVDMYYGSKLKYCVHLST